MLKTNHLPKVHMETSTTGCCPMFNAEEWEGQTITLDQKNFVRVNSRSFLHMPLNLGKVITNTWAAIEAAGAKDPDEFIMLSSDPSAWRGEHLFWTTKEVEGQNNVKLTGRYFAKVFEGNYSEAGNWYKEMERIGQERNGNSDEQEVYFYYTTCPKCAKVYGKNYSVGLVRVK